ncbi:glycoside hydrolase family protein 32 [Klebsiella pneumoniae]|nr:glycoside hydrolase family protein 32 [Klebsiella pneumoniae]
MQCLATSRDGIHFERQGMVVDTPPGMHHFRDPKVWREGDSWYMIVGAREGDTRPGAAVPFQPICASGRTRGCWMKRKAPWGYMWECPDFFTLNGKRVLMFSPQGMQAAGFSNRNLFQSGYLIGEWQPGQRFIRPWRIPGDG